MHLPVDIGVQTFHLSNLQHLRGWMNTFLAAPIAVLAFHTPISFY
jgi:hypothetical protein